MSTAPHIGSVLGGRYVLTRHIARGGMGDVYEADDELLERAVALKLYRAASPPDRARFDAEVRVLASLTHPGLVRVYDAGAVDDDAFVVLELVDGPTLADTMARGPMAPSTVARVGAELAESLEYIHARGVVHRDVTPRNVLCGPDDRTRLVDFGIACLLDAPRVTSPDTAIGTPAYMSPEQVQGHSATGATDVYSLGLVLLEALTGRKAFRGTAQEVAVARLVRAPDTTTDVPGAWSALLTEMVALDPAARPPAAQVRTRLLGLADDGADTAAVAASPMEAIASVMPAAPEAGARRARGQRAPVWAIAAAMALALVSAVTLSGLGGDSTDPEVSTDGSSTTLLAGSVGERAGDDEATRAAARRARASEDEDGDEVADPTSTTSGTAADGGPTTSTTPTRPVVINLPERRTTGTTAAPAPTTTAPAPTTTVPEPTPTTDPPTPTTEPPPATTTP